MVLGERNLVRDGKKRRLIVPWLRMSSSCVRTPPTPVESPTGTDLRTTHGASPPAPDWSFQSVCLYEGEIRRKDLGSQYWAELLPHPQRELWTPVTHNVFGMPCRRNTWLVNSFAVSKAVGSLGRAMKWAAFEKQSTVVRMTELPEDGGSPVIKSSAMCDQGFQGTGSGLRRPAGGELDTFFCAQLGQADTNSWTSRARDGHQKKCCINGQVRFLPRWQENFAVLQFAVIFEHKAKC